MFPRSLISKVHAQDPVELELSFSDSWHASLIPQCLTRLLTKRKQRRLANQAFDSKLALAVDPYRRAALHPRGTDLSHGTLPTKLSACP